MPLSHVVIMTLASLVGGFVGAFAAIVVIVRSFAAFVEKRDAEENATASVAPAPAAVDRGDEQREAIVMLLQRINDRMEFQARLRSQR